MVAMLLTCPSCGGAAAEGAERCAVCDTTFVFAEFRLVRLLGKGGMGSVYEAVRERDGARAAVKLIGLPESGGWAARDMFERSNQALQGLSHPSLPRVYAFDQDDAGQFVLVRELFDGDTLEERVRRRNMRLDPREFRALLESLLELLLYLHTRVPPVLHRDIKPANIMFRSKDDWEPVLVDFDTITPPEGQRTGLTIVGTPGYAAPEQFYGQVSPASDLYSVGVTLLFVATHTDPTDLPRRDGRIEIDRLVAGLDPQVRKVLGRLVEPNVGDRYADAGSALADLRAPVVRRQDAVQPVAPLERVRARQMVIVALVMLAVVGGAVVAVMTMTGGTSVKASHFRPSVTPPIRAPRRSVAAPTPPRPVGCEIATQPSGATVSAAGRELGRTPLRVTSSQRVILKKDGYQAETVDLRAACPSGTIALRALTPKTGAPPGRFRPQIYEGNERALLRIGSSPEGAFVLINGRKVGKTPLRAKLPLGRHQVHLKLGQQSAVRIVELIADEDLFISF